MNAIPVASIPGFAKAETGYIYGFVLSGEQAGRAIQWHEIESHVLSVEGSADEAADDLDREVIWLHMDYSHPAVKAWFNKQGHLGDVVVEALLREENRPRVSAIHDGLLLSLRSINFSELASPEDMVAIRVWTNARIILSTRKRHVLSVGYLAEAIAAGNGPKTASAFIAELAESLIVRMQETLSEVEDSVDDLEERAVSNSNEQLRTQIADLRRQAIALRRYLAPQREALTHLQSEKFNWITVDDRLRLRETTDHLHRYVEDLDAVRDRAAVTQEQLANRVAEQVNARMYVLSLVAAIFLPLGFFTGLLGINVGGIPGSDMPQAFMLVVLSMVALVCCQLVLFKIKKWF